MTTVTAQLKKNHFDFVHARQQAFKTILMALAFPGSICRLKPVALSISKVEMLDIRTRRMGYVSQFFQAIPRVTTMNIVIEPLIDRGWEKEAAIERAKALFQLSLYPNTFPITF